MNFFKWLGIGRSTALTNRYGKQISVPSEPLINDVGNIAVDAAMQIGTVWRAVEIIAKMIATLPWMVYQNNDGIREEARDSELWDLLHERPNMRQTPVEFWIAMLLNLILRGNACAEIERNRNGTAYSLVPLAWDQIELEVKKNGNDVYWYSDGSVKREIKSENMLHIRDMAGGHVGMSRLDYMRISVSEAKNGQRAGNTLFAKNGRTAGILSPEGTLTNEQWGVLQGRVSEMFTGQVTVQVLPGNLKFNPITLTPQDIELLSSRKFSVEELGRWMGVPGILLNQTEGTTTLGSSSGEIIESFFKLTIRPLIVIIEQAVRSRVMTRDQRKNQTAEMNMDALLRALLKDRMEIYAKGVQNGIYSRNECRKKENMAPYQGGDAYTAQSNLLPIEQLGQQNSNQNQS